MVIETLEVSGLGSALQALRLPYGKETRSSKVYLMTINDDNSRYSSMQTISINPQDLHLMQTLVNRGDEHAKVVRGIIVYAKITAPIYWFREEETYRAGHERLSSESTMHIDCKGMTGEELQKAKADIPMGKECTTIDFFSYQCLRNIVKQRKDHRLPEWHQFIDWVKTLPLANELIFTGITL